MSDPDRVDRIVENAARMQTQGAHDTAIHLLRSALAEDPEHALAHSLLALSLVHKKRLYAAESEARTALAVAPLLAGAHHVLGVVLFTQRRFSEARKQLEEARKLDPELAGPLITLARLSVVEDDRSAARALLDQARALEPDDLEVIVALGELALLERKLPEAEQLAREALQIAPDGASSHLLAGNTALAMGDDARALDHARLALRADPTDREAITLLGAVRAKRSFSLGLWWRFHSATVVLGETKLVLALVAMYVAVRFAVILLNHAGHDVLATWAEYIWLAFCAYTWFGPTLFRRMLLQELEQVSLRKGY